MKIRDLLYLFIIMITLNFAVGGLMKPMAENQNNSGLALETYEFFDSEEDDVIPVGAEPKINARSACVLDFETGTILYEKNAYQKRPMASTTKIMTGIIALESCSLDQEVIISGKSAWMYGSKMGLKEGEVVRMKDLLYGLLMCSGNDAAVAIAEHCAGSVEAFAEMMNQKATEIGAYETSFSNPHGLDAENHYTTAYDLAKIARYALKNPTFNEIVQTREYYYKGRTLRSTNEMLDGYTGADGVKTGYTGLAGRCLVTSATRNGLRFISVVLFCDTKSLRSLSSRQILDYAFEHFVKVNLLTKGSILGEIDVLRSRDNEDIPVAISEDVSTVIDKDSRDMLYTRISIPESIMAPVKRGSIMGTVSIFKGDEIIAETSLIATENAEKKTFEDYLSQVLHSWIRILQ